MECKVVNEECKVRLNERRNEKEKGWRAEGKQEEKKEGKGRKERERKK